MVIRLASQAGIHYSEWVTWLTLPLLGCTGVSESFLSLGWAFLSRCSSKPNLAEHSWWLDTVVCPLNFITQCTLSQTDFYLTLTSSPGSSLQLDMVWIHRLVWFDSMRDRIKKLLIEHFGQSTRQPSSIAFCYRKRHDAGVVYIDTMISRNVRLKSTRQTCHIRLKSQAHSHSWTATAENCTYCICLTTVLTASNS